MTKTAIPLDPVFDEVITEGKILFLHRLASKGAACYLKLIHELFDLDEEKVWEMVMEKRNERRKDEARQRFWEAKGKNMNIRYYLDPGLRYPHIYDHDIIEEEVEDVLNRPGEDRKGKGGSRVAIGTTRAGRFLKVVYVLDQLKR